MSEEDKIALDIIRARDEELDKRRGFWDNLWQDAADLCYPREDQINTKTQPGRDKSVDRYDDTAVLDSQKMASGLSGTIIPLGQQFFGLRVKNRKIAQSPAVKEWMWIATEIAHDELMASNFMLHLNEFFRSLVVFGTGNLYSEWDVHNGQLNFKDHAISTYVIKEDSYGNVDTVIMSYKLTARQAVQKFGEENVHEKVRKAAEELTKESKKFSFIHIVRPRSSMNPLFKDNKNMPFESLHVDETNKMVVLESGYQEFPYAVARWSKGSTEKWGRGPGTDSLAYIRELQYRVATYKDLSEKIGNPPTITDESFEGDLDLRPGAINKSIKTDSVKSLLGALGNPLQLEQNIKDLRDMVHEAFYVNVFTPITPLQGTHRTAEEMQARQQEGLQQLASPISRLESEGMSPLLMRCIMLLIRNGRIPTPPPELLKVIGRTATTIQVDVDASQLGIEYLGPMALALRNQQARGFQGFAANLMQMAPVLPEVLDFLNLDNAIPRLAQLTGVNSADVSTADQVAAKRQARAKAQQQQAMMQAAQVGGKAYKDATKAPESGSAAEALMEAAK